ncbi:MAG TPA: SDR family NAD(P)-dependent oxidoreductase, partial [Aestuariivirga sp.]|nr:SDR family NAD(P)-dependent oxidoreductase [Aestuariivirga sp.]
MNIRSVLVTGAARRIGRQMALDLAGEGWDVAVHCNASRGEAEEVARLIDRAGRKSIVVQGDLALPEVPERLIAEASQALGGLTCLINNASVFEPDVVGSITAASWARHLDINLRAPVFLSQAFAKQLPKRAHGNIVNIIDQRVLRPTPQFFSYSASKAGLWAVTRTMAQALAPRIRVN